VSRKEKVMTETKPAAVVTGANRGIGLEVCPTLM